MRYSHDLWQPCGQHVMCLLYQILLLLKKITYVLKKLIMY